MIPTCFHCNNPIDVPLLLSVPCRYVYHLDKTGRIFHPDCYGAFITLQKRLQENVDAVWDARDMTEDDD